MLTERRTHRLCLNAEADGPAKCPAVAVQASDVAWECIPLLPPAGFTRENADAIVAKLDAMARPTMIQYAALFPVPCSHAFPQHLQGFPPWRQQSIATPQVARGRSRPPCRHFKTQSCSCLSSAFEVLPQQTLPPCARLWVRAKGHSSHPASPTHTLPADIRCSTATRASAALVLYLATKQGCDHAGAMQLATLLNLKCKDAPAAIVQWIGLGLQKTIVFRQMMDTSGSSTYTYLLADPSTKEALLIDPVLEMVRVSPSGSRIY